ncbi:hypothetical protein C8Q78DRAFT_1058001 [Trametes maxima]|nr:hypothetical protein C8Q78DRAFT_1058001 [Trametes maxima]
MQDVRESSATADVVTDPAHDPDAVPVSDIAESSVTDVVESPASDAVGTPAADAPDAPSDDVETPRPTEVSRGWLKQLNCSVIKSRRSSLASTISSRRPSTPEMSSPAPSGPTQAGTPEHTLHRTSSFKARAAIDRLRTCGKNATKKLTKGEPVRYARPARPENSLPGVVFSQRYESPLKAVFKGRSCSMGELYLPSSVRTDR